MPKKRKSELNPNRQTIDTPSVKVGNRAPIIRRLHTSYPELTIGGIARRVGVSKQYTGRVLRRFMAHTEEDLRDYQENKADIYDAIQQQILESATPAKISKMSVSAAIVSAAILHDKAALLRGQPTGINVQVIGDVLELIRAKRDEK